jgi:hypothetical protein
MLCKSLGSRVALGDGPTMEGFEWAPAELYVPTADDEDGWCVRDVLCQLFGWECDSDQWSRFVVEGIAWPETVRVAEHLGLTVFEFPADWNKLIDRSAHPGVGVFIFPTYKLSHVAYVPDVQWLLHHWPTPVGPPATPETRPLVWCGWPLGEQHVSRGPLLAAELVDEREERRPI